METGPGGVMVGMQRGEWRQGVMVGTVCSLLLELKGTQLTKHTSSCYNINSSHSSRRRSNCIERGCMKMVQHTLGQH